MICYKVTQCNLARPSNQRAVDLRPIPPQVYPSIKQRPMPKISGKK